MKKAILLIVPIAAAWNLKAQLIDESFTRLLAGEPTDTTRVVLNVTVYYTEGVDYLERSIPQGLQLTSSEGSFLQPSRTLVAFSPGSNISSSSWIYTNQPAGSTRTLGILWYSWTEHRPGPWITAQSVRDPFPGQTNILIGFSRPHPQGTGTQYGWVRLERDTPNPSDIFWPDGREKRVAFWPAGSAVHPIPDRPIRAGEAPDLPQLTSEFLPAMESLPARIRVQWPAGWDTLRLEQVTDLAQPVLWTRVPEVVGSSAEFALPEDGQLFLRLVHVP
jgi:hypothetical protein